MKKFFALACAVALALTACTDPKVEAKDQLEKLVSNVEANSANFDEKDWHEFLVEYNKVDSLVGLYDYPEEERQEIGRLKGKCASYVVKASAAEAKAKLREAAGELKGMVEGFVEGMNSK